MYAISPWKSAASHCRNCSACRGGCALVMPTRSKPRPCARCLICRASAPLAVVPFLVVGRARPLGAPFGGLFPSGTLTLQIGAVDSDDLIGLLLDAHRRGVDAVWDDFVKRLAIAQQRLDPRQAIRFIPQQRAVLRILGALMRHVGVHPTTNDDAVAAEIADVVRIQHDAPAGGNDPVLLGSQLTDQRPFLLAKECLALHLENL